MCIVIEKETKRRKNHLDDFNERCDKIFPYFILAYGPSTNAILNHSMMTPCFYLGKKGGLCTIPPSRYLNRRHIDRGKSSRGGRR